MQITWEENVVETQEFSIDLIINQKITTAVQVFKKCTNYFLEFSTEKDKKS
jgi:hypothetical protein